MNKPKSFELKILHQFKNLEVDGNIPIHVFHKYEIYKLKIDGQKTDMRECKLNCAI